MARTSYHTVIKELVHHGLLPKELLKQIPKSNISRWLREDMSKYKGSELNEAAVKHGDAIKTVTEFPQMLYAYASIVETLISMVSLATDFKKLVKENKEKVVDIISKTKEVLPLKNITECFKISKGTFYNWVSLVKSECKNSPVGKCLKTFPQQITSSEINRIKKAILNPCTSHWFLKSIYLKGLRDGTIAVSESTFYKVNRTHGFRPSKPKKKKRKYDKGIRAEKPNQYWHLYITKVTTLDGESHDVQIIVDNYSKYVLAAEIVDAPTGANTVKNLRKAHRKAKSTGKHLNVKLIVDGGTENNNFEVEDFIKDSKINIEKFIAKKDTKKSNSMVERVNSDFKQGYIYPRDIENVKQLKRRISYFTHDFNCNRPHSTLNGSTPEEAWTGNEFPLHKCKKHMKTIRNRRIEFNKSQVCNTCKI